MLTQSQRVILSEELERDEGRILHAYKDSKGFWTIGVGRLIDRRVGGGITDAECDVLLQNDIASHEQELFEALPWAATLSPVRQRVLVNMAFNLGVPKLMMFKNTLAAARRGDIAAVKRGMLESKWRSDVGDRALRLADAYVHGGER